MGRDRPPRRATRRGCRPAPACVPPGAPRARRRRSPPPRAATISACAIAESTSRPRPPTSSSAPCTSGGPSTGWSSWPRSTSPARSSRSPARSRASGCGQAVVAVDAPSGHRLDLLGPDSAIRGRARAARRALRADAGLRHAAVPPRAAALPGPVRRPAAGARGRTGCASASSCSRRSADLRLYRPAQNGCEGPVGEHGAHRRAPVRDLPGRDLLRAARPPPGRQAHAVRAAGADRRAQAQGDRRRGRRAVAPHARRARRLRRRLRRLRAGGRASGAGSGTPRRA